MAQCYSLLYLAGYLGSGYAVSRRLFRRERPAVRLWLGGVAGLFMLLWFPVLWAFLLDFTVAAQLLGLLTAAAAAALALFLPGNAGACGKGALKDELPLLCTVLPLFLFGSILFCTHLYEQSGALFVGQSTYGDLAMHLGFITSITVQKTFPPMYSICPGTPLGYPFLCDSVSSTFYTLGAPLIFSTLLPAILAYLLVLTGVYFFFERWLKRPRAAVLATLLFFVGGGFGFAYYLDLAKLQPDRFFSLFTAFYETPTNNPSYGLRWVNTIADMLIPQRATLFGWALLFPCLYLLKRAAFEKETELFVPLGVLAGALPLVHTHSFFALGLVSCVYLLESLIRREEKRQLLGYLKYALLAAVLAGPQLILFTFRQSGGFLTLRWNWDNVSDSYLWFYVKNWGLLFLLLIPALIENGREDREIFAGVLLLWGLAETVQFQPNPYDNNKLLFVLFAYLCAMTAKWLTETFTRAFRNAEGENRSPAGLHFIALLVTVCLFLSGTLTLLREWKSRYMLINREEYAAAAYLSGHSEPDAVFLTSNNHNNAVAVLTGRNIVCGTGSYLFYHGIDYQDRENDLKRMFETPENCFEELQKKYGVDYVYVGAYERYNYAVNTEWFSSRFPVLYQGGGITVYDARTPAA